MSLEVKTYLLVSELWIMPTIWPIADPGARQVKQKRQDMKLTVSIPRSYRQLVAPLQTTPLKKLTVCLPRIPSHVVGSQPQHVHSDNIGELPIDYHRHGFTMVEGSEQMMSSEQRTSENTSVDLHVFLLTIIKVVQWCVTDVFVCMLYLQLHDCICRSACVRIRDNYHKANVRACVTEPLWTN